MFKYVKMSVAGAALAIASTAQAGWFTTSNLEDLFNGTPYERGAASGFVVGIASAIDGTAACFNNNVKVGDMTDLVESALKAFPEYGQRPASITVGAALAAAYPCRSKRNTF